VRATLLRQPAQRAVEEAVALTFDVAGAVWLSGWSWRAAVEAAADQMTSVEDPVGTVALAVVQLVAQEAQAASVSFLG